MCKHKRVKVVQKKHRGLGKVTWINCIDCAEQLKKTFKVQTNAWR